MLCDFLFTIAILQVLILLILHRQVLVIVILHCQLIASSQHIEQKGVLIL